jgi:pyruvate,water dikinase
MAERWIVDDEPSTRYPIYTRGNVGEVFPDPVCPFSATLAITPYAEPGWRDAYERAGIFDQDEFSADSNEIVAILGGYCYLNVSIVRIMGVRLPGMTPEMVDVALFGEQPGVPPYEPHPDDDREEKGVSSFEWMIGVMTATDLPDVLEDRDRTVALREQRPDLSAMTNEELVAYVRRLYADHFRHLFAQHLYVSNGTQIPLGIISQVCEALGDPSLAMRLVAGLGDVESAGPSWTMWELSRRVAASPVLTSEFDAGVEGLLDRLEAHRGVDEVDTFLGEFATFLREFGSRGPNEWEMASATWETKPELALAAVDRMRLMDDADAPQRHHEERIADREALSAEIIEKLADQPELQEQFSQALAAAQVFFPGRERTKTNAIRMTHEGRMAMHELGRRMVEAGHFDRVEDFSMLTDSELDDFLADPAAFRDVIRERRARYDELRGLEPPFVFKGEQPPVESWTARDDRGIEPAGPGDELRGIPGCPGRATGRARVVLDPSDPTALEPGDVLVAPITDPAWTPLFVPAAAVVVDVGAQLSHAIIVSRELGIPCVVSVTDATERIPDGALVTVDGDSGTVTVEEG